VDVLTGNAEEQRSRRYSAGVVRNVVDAHVAVSVQARTANTNDTSIIDKVLKDHGHGGRSSRPHPPPEQGGPLSRHAGRRELYHGIQPGFLVLLGFGGSTAGVALGVGDALGVGLGAGGACARISLSDGPPGSGAAGPIPRCASE